MTKELNMTESEKRESEAAKIAPMIRDLHQRINTPMYINLMNALASERMAKYRAHIKAGFTEAQALDLCKL
jgi:hypothetical protein